MKVDDKQKNVPFVTAGLTNLTLLEANGCIQVTQAVAAADGLMLACELESGSLNPRTYLAPALMAAVASEIQEFVQSVPAAHYGKGKMVSRGSFERGWYLRVQMMCFLGSMVGRLQVFTGDYTSTLRRRLGRVNDRTYEHWDIVEMSGESGT